MTATKDGMVIDWDLPIVMDDGIVMYADVFRPVEDGEYPVILSYGPYAKGWRFEDGYPSAWEAISRDHPEVLVGSSNKYQQWEVVDPEKWVPDGFVCVRVDSRGAGRSPGYLEHFSQRETVDFAACVDWAGIQPWSNGKVGLAGISYYAINQWHVAGRKSEHLAAICPFEGAADFYRDMSHHGGILSSFWEHWYDKQIKVVQYGLGENGPTNPNNGILVCGDETFSEGLLEANRSFFGDDIRRRPVDSEWYRERSADWSRVTVPLLTCGNWGGQGLHLRGNIEAFVRAASEHKWLEVHGYAHWTEFYTDYGVALQKAFFGHFLRGDDNGWLERSRVHLRVRHLDGFIDRDEHEWPLARTRWTHLHLDATTRSLAATAPSASASVTYEPLGDGVHFRLPAFDEEIEITGPMAARLHVSSASVDADLFLVVRVHAPDGSEVVFHGANDPHTPIAQGWLRVSHRALDAALTEPYRPFHTHVDPQQLIPGEVVELDVEIWPTSLVIPPGHQLSLSVLGHDYEWDGPPAFLKQFKNPLRGCGPFLHDDPADRPEEIFGRPVTLHTGPEHPSWLLVPFVPAQDQG